MGVFTTSNTSYRCLRFVRLWSYIQNTLVLWGLADTVLGFPYHIQGALPNCISIRGLGAYLKNKCITLYSDNDAVVYIINKHSCKDSQVMHLVRRLVLACMEYNILIHAEHIPGKVNTLSDLLSRLQVRFQELASNMDQQPTKLPEQLLQLH